MNKGEYYERLYKERKEQQEKQDKERKERQEKLDKERNKRKRSDFVFGRDGKGSLFTLVFTLLLIIVFARALIGQEINVTFKGFLDMLSSVPDVSISWLNGIDLNIVDDWGLVNFLRDFLNNFLLEPLEVLCMLAGGILQLFAFLGYFTAYIFTL